MNDAPTVLIDNREQRALEFTNLPTESGTLYSGDYSIKNLEEIFVVERKNTNDLVGSLTSGRDRFAKECHRLRGYNFARLLIEGTEDDILNHRYHSKASPKAILHSLSAFEIRYRLPVVFGGSRESCARLVERWAWWFWREQTKAMDLFQHN